MNSSISSKKNSSPLEFSFSDETPISREKNDNFEFDHRSLTISAKRRSNSIKFISIVVSFLNERRKKTEKNFLSARRKEKKRFFHIDSRRNAATIVRKSSPRISSIIVLRRFLRSASIRRFEQISRRSTSEIVVTKFKIFFVFLLAPNRNREIDFSTLIENVEEHRANQSDQINQFDGEQS